MNNNLDAGYRNDWLHKMASVCEASSTIDSTLFERYEVKRGLRDLNARGVLTYRNIGNTVFYYCRWSECSL